MKKILIQAFHMYRLNTQRNTQRVSIIMFLLPIMIIALFISPRVSPISVRRCTQKKEKQDQGQAEFTGRLWWGAALKGVACILHLTVYFKAGMAEWLVIVLHIFAPGYELSQHPSSSHSAFTPSLTRTHSLTHALTHSLTFLFPSLLRILQYLQNYS
jgi:fatty acid desaturase